MQDLLDEALINVLRYKAAQYFGLSPDHPKCFEAAGTMMLHASDVLDDTVEEFFALEA